MAEPVKLKPRFISAMRTKSAPPTSTKSLTRKEMLAMKDRGKQQLPALWELNVSVATLRDLLVEIGRPKDGPEVREKIRRARQNCIEAMRKLCDAFIPLVCKEVSEGIPVDNEEFIILFSSLQLLQRELCKCYRLLALKPIDMSQYNDFFCLPGGTRASMSVLGHIVLSTCRQLAPEWNKEDKMALERELNEVSRRLHSMQQYLPCEGHLHHSQQQRNCQASHNLALTGEDKFSQWQKQRHRHKISSWSLRKRLQRSKSTPSPGMMLRMLPFVALLPAPTATGGFGMGTGAAMGPPTPPIVNGPSGDKGAVHTIPVDVCDACGPISSPRRSPAKKHDEESDASNKKITSA